MTIDLETAAVGTIFLMAAAYLAGRSIEHTRVADAWKKIEAARDNLRAEWGKLNYERFKIERDRVLYQEERREVRRGLS